MLCIARVLAYRSTASIFKHIHTAEEDEEEEVGELTEREKAALRGELLTTMRQVPGTLCHCPQGTMSLSSGHDVIAFTCVSSAILVAVTVLCSQHAQVSKVSTGSPGGPLMNENGLLGPFPTDLVVLLLTCYCLVPGFVAGSSLSIVKRHSRTKIPRIVSFLFS